MKKYLTIIVYTILILLVIKYSFTKQYDLFFDLAAAFILLIIFNLNFKHWNQNNISYFFLILTLLLHNFHLYAAKPFGIPFDHYMHFIAGFTIALIFDRLLFELPIKKRFFLIIVAALGIGAVGEIAEWIGYSIFNAGEGFFFYGVGDEGEWRNATFDMIFNGIGGISAAFVLFFSKKQLEIKTSKLHKNYNKVQ